MAAEQSTARPGDAVVQLPPDGGGKKIRHVALDLYDPEQQTTTTVYVPTFFVIDEETGEAARIIGGRLEAGDDRVLTLLERIAESLELILATLDG